MAQTAFKTNPVSLEDLLKECGSGKIQLPDFQRSWVWDEDRIKSLIASISEAFPVGALMTLEMKAGAADTFARRPIQGAPPEASSQAPDQLLLDGQQRMTSLYQTCMRRQVVETITARQKLVKRWFYIDIEKALRSDFDREDAIFTLPEDRKIKEDFDRKITLDLSTAESEYEQLMFPVNQVFNWDAWQDGFGDYWIGKGDVAKRQIFQRFKNEVLQHFKSYQVPVIALGHDTSHEAVCLVFEKVNTGGKALDAFELVTAMYAAEGYRLRDDWLGAAGSFGQQSRLQHFGHMAGQKYGVLEKVASTDFLQAVALLHTKKVRQEAVVAGVKESDLPAVRATRQSLLDLPLSAYKANKDRVEQGFTTAAKFLRQQFIYRGIDLPYQTQIVPLAAILAEIGDKWEHAENKRKLARWYWCGIFGELYGSAVESRFAKDIVEVPAWLAGGPEPTTVRDGVLRSDRLRTMRSRGSAAYKGVHALLMQEGAKDFRTGQTFDQTVFFDEDVDIHHIFPQDWCRNQGIEAKVYDSIINKTPLSYRTNRRIGGVAPSIYLQRLESGQKDDPPIVPTMMDGYLQTHCIAPELLRSDAFDRFMNDREQRLLALIARVTGHDIVAAGSSSDEQEVPDDIAEDSGLMVSTAA
ncbi:GmrSD restriction endonuclease domain-containing protein [Rhodopseudomonas telluris]|uniref:DUF262 domain-containing protein n=1 Tax=Rhodopseudomonas telluris TaxID=644215 RepID=A0ABV6EWY8_9BRAD